MWFIHCISFCSSLYSCRKNDLKCNQNESNVNASCFLVPFFTWNHCNVKTCFTAVNGGLEIMNSIQISLLQVWHSHNYLHNLEDFSQKSSPFFFLCVCVYVLLKNTKSTVNGDAQEQREIKWNQEVSNAQTELNQENKKKIHKQSWMLFK